MTPGSASAAGAQRVSCFGGSQETRLQYLESDPRGDDELRSEPGDPNARNTDRRDQRGTESKGDDADDSGNEQDHSSVVLNTYDARTQCDQDVRNARRGKE